MNAKATIFDALILFFFVVLITYQPFLLHHEIIMMETGIHLPGIYALFHGAIPYRDFLYFRGPLELYVPALVMKLFGDNMIWLPVFYYVGTVLTLLLGVLLASQLYRTRLVLYLMAFVLVARTFPRISFYYWGGMRYALGMLALVLAVQSFQSKRSFWMFWAGITSCLAFWTTIEAGVCTLFAIGGMLALSFMFRKDPRSSIVEQVRSYVLGFLFVFIPVVVYMWSMQSLFPYLETVHVVLTKSFKTFMNGPDIHPVGVMGFLSALLPASKFFKSMTPVYFYLVLVAYFFYRRRNRTFNAQVFCLICIALYGMILYITGFRRLDGHHFEMALHPEKILFFFLLEELYLSLIKIRGQEVERVKALAVRGWQFLTTRKKIYLINFLILAFIGSSVGYAVARYNNRFVMAKLLGNKLGSVGDEDLTFLVGIEKREVNIKRAKGMVVPAWQAREMEEIVAFLEKNTKPDEAVFTYPELGNYSFWADRPFVGRFPIATFSWMDERWYEELIADFKKTVPRYVIMTNLGHRTFPSEWYFRNTNNIAKFNAMTELILDNYRPIKRFESVSLYERR